AGMNPFINVHFVKHALNLAFYVSNTQHNSFEVLQKRCSHFDKVQCEFKYSEIHLLGALGKDTQVFPSISRLIQSCR
ncbi:hypothetical protein, partial [Lentibacillus cibarius]|uniref:hypothetical protein n=1 Tax=Lentibacillus cibarius TaxID=2583219 RepID=UPI001F18061C